MARQRSSRPAGHFSWRHLKNKLGAYLQNTARPRSDDLAVLRVVRVVVNRTADIRASKRVVSILGVVKDVEAFHADLKSDSLREVERLAEADVPVVDPGLS